MSDDVRSALLRQLDTAWALAGVHLDTLTTAECLRRPAPRGLHVQRDAGGRWVADWPEHEGYDLGPPSIAWLTWHLTFWWSMALDHSFGPGTLTREAVAWPGDADGARAGIRRLHGQWRGRLETLDPGDFASSRLARWPFRDRPFADVAAWVNVELTKNAAEIGYARFLLAVT
jgi:hypothetical protein